MTFEIHEFYHLERYGHWKCGNTYTFKFPSKPHAIENQDCQDPEVSDELKDEQEEDILTLPEALESVGLSEYLSTLEKEEIDMESL
eukprot:g46399.t1